MNRLLHRGSGRYDIVLMLVVGALVLSPFNDRTLGVAVVVALALIFVFALWTANVPRRYFVVAVTFSIVSLITSIAAQFDNGDAPRAVIATVSAVLCATTIGAIAFHLIAKRQVTTRTLAGSLAIYILFGLLFASIYALIGIVRNDGFFAQSGPQDAVSYLYFSFIALTTVGFGDLTPANDAGRMLVAIEALFGQLYLVTVVAVVVSNRRRQ
ncbi:potassium channel family protein [Jatrophihabitans sp. GAS493]|uniref:potassium channel family protein n=1 Tax=Jatrophihabitans sp. GAS493 TaxID=1907575 RepID=UPI0012FD27FB|nr:potassium channel family protein [Jatrophihabitans sp. GAS493]